MICGVGDVAVLLFPCLKLWFLARSIPASLHLQLTSNQHGNLTGTDLHSLPDYQLNHNGKSASMRHQFKYLLVCNLILSFLQLPASPVHSPLASEPAWISSVTGPSCHLRKQTLCSVPWRSDLICLPLCTFTPLSLSPVLEAGVHKPVHSSLLSAPLVYSPLTYLPTWIPPVTSPSLYPQLQPISHLTHIQLTSSMVPFI